MTQRWTRLVRPAQARSLRQSHSHFSKITVAGTHSIHSWGCGRDKKRNRRVHLKHRRPLKLQFHELPTTIAPLGWERWRRKKLSLTPICVKPTLAEPNPLFAWRCGAFIYLSLKKLFTVAKKKARDFFLITISICSVLSEPNNGSFCGIFIFLLFLYSVCLTGNDLLAGWRSKALTHKVLPEILWNTQKCASYSEERIIPQCMELIWFQFFFAWRCLVAHCPSLRRPQNGSEVFFLWPSFQKGRRKKHHHRLVWNWLLSVSSKYPRVIW